MEAAWRNRNRPQRVRVFRRAVTSSCVLEDRRNSSACGGGKMFPAKYPSICEVRIFAEENP